MCSLLLVAKIFDVSLGEGETKTQSDPRSVCAKKNATQE